MTRNAKAERASDPAKIQYIRWGRRADWIITAVFMVIAIGFIAMLQSLPQRATFFPWFITIAMVLIGAVYSVGKWRNPARWDNHYAPEDETDTGPTFLLTYAGGVVKAVIIFTALVLGAIAFGPEFAVPIYVTTALWLSKESKITAVLSGLGFWLVIHFVFGDFMSINLPTGYLTDLIF